MFKKGQITFFHLKVIGITLIPLLMLPIFLWIGQYIDFMSQILIHPLTMILYLLSFSILWGIIEFKSFKSKKAPFLRDKHHYAYYLMTMGIGLIIMIYMVIFSIFGSYSYDVLSYFLTMMLILCVIGMFYIPALFTEMIEDSKIGSVLYMGVMRLMMQTMCITLGYIIIIIIQGGV